jgi:hypothetical protein
MTVSVVGQDGVVGDLELTGSSAVVISVDPVKVKDSINAEQDLLCIGPTARRIVFVVDALV